MYPKLFYTLFGILSHAREKSKNYFRNMQNINNLDTLSLFIPKNFYFFCKLVHVLCHIEIGPVLGIEHLVLFG